MIHAWDTYPCGQFPGLWAWMADRVVQGLIQMSEVAIDEAGHKVPECEKWLQDTGLQKLSVTEAMLLEAARIKDLLGTDGEQYGSGVDENDLITIATAKLHGCEWVTNEAFQPSLNKQKRNWKIPAVCNMGSVDVEWIAYLDYLKRTAAVFG